MFFKQDRKKYVYLLVCFITFIFIFPKVNLAKISDKNAIKTFWKVLPIIPGAAKYFIRTEKIEKKTKVLNNHPIKISDDILRKMLKQLVYKYDRDEAEIPLFSNKELLLLSEYIPQALLTAKPNEDVTFVVKGPHKSARWSFSEDRLTAGRVFISDNKLNLILGSVQVNLQPTLAERYEGNVWETAKLTYDIGHRRKKGKYEGLIMVYDQNQKGIYRKSKERKDWFVFTNTAYKQAVDDINQNKIGKEQYKTLQQQIDTLQKQLNQPQQQKQKRNYTPPPQQQQQIKRASPRKQSPENSKNNNDPKVIEQRLKTIDSLYNKGMLSDEEYKRKRNEILKGL